MLQKIKKTLKSVPPKDWLISLGCYLLIYGLYRLADLLSRITGTIDNAWCPKIAAIDDLFPIIPVFTVIYLFSYIFWICGFVAVKRTGKKNFINYVFGLFASCAAGFLIFAVFPSYMDRVGEGLYEAAARPGAFNFVLKCISLFDGQEQAFDLFPSYHVLMSLCCYLGVRKQPEISKGFQIYTLVMTVLICFACLLVKQHYFLDIIGGLVITFAVYKTVEKINPAKRFPE